MADWYVSSAAYATIAAFVPSVSYSVGQIVKPTAPALKAQWVFRCTTAGTASTEPAWTTANNSTIATGGATFTNVTGQSTYGWSAAAGDIPTLIGAVGTFRFAGGDRMFVSSDHSETQTATTTYGSGTGTAVYASGQVLSVNRAGSVPPVAADLTAGATVTVSGAATQLNLDATFPVYHFGMNYVYTGSNTVAIGIAATGAKLGYFDTCQIYLNTATTSCRIQGLSTSAQIALSNSTVRFGAAGQTIFMTINTTLQIDWLNTPSAIQGTGPTTLFNNAASSVAFSTTMRGVDLSAVTGTLIFNSQTTGSKYLFDSCRIASGVVRYATTSVGTTRDLVELVNCYDGTNIINESYQPSGAVTTEFAITLSGGATDNVGTFSHKMVSNANLDPYVQPLSSFWLDVNNTAIGSSHTATVEIVSSASLNNNDIWLILEYPGTASSSLASMATTLPATVLTAVSAVPSSSATWNSLPATPVRQHLQVTFTPQTAGRVRAQVRLGKANTTVYVNPQVIIT